MIVPGLHNIPRDLSNPDESGMAHLRPGREGNGLGQKSLIPDIQIHGFTGTAIVQDGGTDIDIHGFTGTAIVQITYP